MYDANTDTFGAVATYTILALYLINPKIAIFLMSFGVAFYLAFGG